MYVLLRSSLLYTIHPSKAKEQGGSILTTALLFSTCSCNSPSADSIRIRRVSRRGGAFFALQKTYLTRADGREELRSDQSASAEPFRENGRSHFYEIVR